MNFDFLQIVPSFSIHVDLEVRKSRPSNLKPSSPPPRFMIVASYKVDHCPWIRTRSIRWFMTLSGSSGGSSRTPWLGNQTLIIIHESHLMIGTIIGFTNPFKVTTSTCHTTGDTVDAWNGRKILGRKNNNGNQIVHQITYNSNFCVNLFGSWRTVQQGLVQLAGWLLACLLYNINLTKICMSSRILSALTN